MDSIERGLLGDLQHYRTELQELKRCPGPDAGTRARVLHLQRRIACCEGWLRAIGVSQTRMQEELSPGVPGAVVALADSQRRGLAPASSMLTRASAAQSKSA
jgi:hypothetical protein